MASRLLLGLSKVNRSLLLRLQPKSNFHCTIAAKGFSSSVISSRVTSRHNFLVPCGQNGSSFITDKRSSLINPYGLRFKSDHSLEDIISFDTSELISDGAEVIQDVAQQIGEVASFQSLGLCNSTPVGLLQSVFEYLHVTLDISWMPTIFICTLALRMIILPLNIMGMKNAIRLSNISPQLKEVQEEIKYSSNDVGSGRYMMGMQKMRKLYKDNNCSMQKALIVPMAQVPMMISFFLAIRKMAMVPVESMTTGGALWFVNLTVPDPFYILPLGCVGLMLLLFEVGGETGTQTEQMEKYKNFFRLLACVSFPFIMNFPAGVQLYWITTNSISVIQTLILKTKFAKRVLDMPVKVQHEGTQAMGPLEMIEEWKKKFSDNQEKSRIKEWDLERKKRGSSYHGNPVQPTFEHNPQSKINEELFEEERVKMENSKINKRKKKGSSKKKRRDYMGPRM